MTAIGIMIAARMTAIQSFMAVMQMFIMPLFFLSGAMFPLTDLPAWLTVLTRLNPLTYAIDPMRRIMFHALDLSPSVLALFSPGVTWGDWRVPVSLELAIVAATGVVALTVAIREFNTAE
jgi:ABC-2 type transport system permease protein